MPVTIIKKAAKAPRRLPVASLQRWQLLCADLGIRADVDFYRQLVKTWAARTRHYHTLAHLEACLRELESVRSSAQEPAEIEFALWFHDAVYRTYRRDNEERSGAWAKQVLVQNGGTPEQGARVERLIVATKHVDWTQEADTALTVDIDLAVLGEEPDLYDEFEQNIRREYWWVPARRYHRARHEILSGFVVRDYIYNSPQFRDRYERKARQNLNRTIKKLGQLIE